MDLFDAFYVKKGDVVALVGAGGKTSTMFAMGKEAVERGLKTVITTTTRIYLPGEKSGLPVVCAPGAKVLEEAKNALGQSLLVVAGAGIEGNKLIGLTPELTGGFTGAGFDLVLVEADGAAGRPFKGPCRGEPVIPGGCTLVIPVMGMDCLGKPFDSRYVHRAEEVARLLGPAAGEIVTPQMVASILLHPEGYRKNISSGSRWIPFLNKVQDENDLLMAGVIAAILGEQEIHRIVMGAAQEKDPVREVALF
jgi:probable selenium-dependent hydroxylase accessory protein YqeC